MIQTMDDMWPHGDHMQWGDFGSQGLMDYTNMWCDPAWEMDPSYYMYGQAIECDGSFEDWTGYDGVEDWGRRAPKFPPPPAPAPTLVASCGSTPFDNIALKSQELSCLTPAAPESFQAPGMAQPPGLIPPATKSVDLEVIAQDGDRGRPNALGLSTMMELASELKDPVHRPVTPATSTPPTPASSLSEFEASSTPEAPGSSTSLMSGSESNATEENPQDVGAGYTLFGSSPWNSLQLGGIGQQCTEDASLPARILRAPPKPIGSGAPAKVKLEDLISNGPKFEDAPRRDAEETLLGGPLGSLHPHPGFNLHPPPGLPSLGIEDPVLKSKAVRRPPGLELAPVAEIPEEAVATPVALPTPIGALGAQLPSASHEDKGLENVSVEQTEVDGTPCTRAVWRIVQLRGRLKTSLGKPVVSPSFAISGLGDLRLMVTPDAKGTLEGMRGKSKQSHFAKMLSHGPLECSLKVKVPCTSTPIVKFYLTVGSNCRKGPFTCDFTEHTMHGCNDFDCDWLKQVDDEGCLCVGLEIVEVRADGQRPA